MKGCEQKSQEYNFPFSPVPRELLLRALARRAAFSLGFFGAEDDAGVGRAVLASDALRGPLMGACGGYGAVRWRPASDASR